MGNILLVTRTKENEKMTTNTLNSFNDKASIAEFGFQGAAQIPSFGPHKFQYAVPDKELYVFRKDLFNPVLYWLRSDDCKKEGLYLTGPAGSGKTSLPEQIAARLNWPCLTVSCNSRMTVAELIGYTQLTCDPVTGDQTTQWVDGPLTTAWRNGFILILDEYDYLDVTTSAGLNGVFEHKPLVLDQNNGEVLKAHPFFRVITTGNTAGLDDETGLMTGTQRQNPANIDRFMTLIVPYMDIGDELNLLQSHFPQNDQGRETFPTDVLIKMLDVATAIRKQYIGNLDSSSSGEGQFTFTMSTRTLVRWAKKVIMCKQIKSNDPITDALAMSFTNKLSSAEAMAVKEIVKLKFGN